MLQIAIMSLVSVLLFEAAYVDCQYNNLRRPEDLFPNNPIYVPPYQNAQKAANPFRDTFGREYPDTLSFGFFPIWSALLVAIALVFGVIGIIGFVCHLLGCRNPNKIETKPRRKMPKYFHHDEDEYENDTSLRMIETNTDKEYERSFNKSKLINTDY